VTPVNLWLVRHGETEWSKSGRHTGWTDVPLLTEGRAQALSDGEWLRRAVPAPALVLTSPLSRAAETCRLAGFGEGAERCDDLKEWDYGEYDGLTTDEIRAGRPGWSIWADGVVGGESAADVGRRADRVIERALGAGGDVVLFSHGHLLRVLAARWVGLPPVGGRVLALGAGGVCELGWERETRVISCWNVVVGEPQGP
jgi:broad specificity phosphatase PhoE